MSSLLTYSKSVLAPTSAAARLILRNAGFDTPVAISSAAATPQAGISTVAPMSAPTCPIGVGSSGPSIFASSSRCPCGLYPADGTPGDCPSSIKAKAMRAPMGTPTLSITPSSTRLHARAFSTVAPMRAAGPRSVEASPSAVPPTESDSTPRPTPPASTSASTTSSTAAPTSTPSFVPGPPSLPAAVSLPSAFSAAHSSLLAIEDYRAGIQALSRGSLASAKQLLARTQEIVAYVPAQPFLALYVRHLLASIAEREGRWTEERRLRADIIKEVEKQWGKGPASASAVKEAELLVASQMLQAYGLACLRADARAELRAMVEAWMPRLESLLFGRPPSPPPPGTATNTGSAASRGAQAHPAAFSTGATHLRLLAQYLALAQVGLYERATRPPPPTAGLEAPKQPALERGVAQLARVINARPHLRSSAEWRLFQGELLLLPDGPATAGMEGLEGLLPPEPNDTSVTPPAADASPAVLRAHRLHRAVRYFESHPDLQRVPLNESHMRREWSAPLVYAYLGAAEISAELAAAGSSSVMREAGLRSPSDLLAASLQFVEQSISDDPSHPLLLRTLLPLALQAIEQGEAIQAEGLLRNILGKLEAQLALHESTPVLDATRWRDYLDALLEYAVLLTNLEWNKMSRRNEARSVLHQRLLRLARDPQARALLQALQPTARRNFILPSPPHIERADQVTDDMLELARNPRAQAAVPQWMVDQMRVGTGL